MTATNSLPWNEEAIELNYCKEFHTNKLYELKEFFQNGMDFNVIETKHSYVQEDPNAVDDDGKTSTYSGKGNHCRGHTEMLRWGHKPNHKSLASLILPLISPLIVLAK